MARFLGTHHTRLDAKNRTSVPAAFRTTLRDGVPDAPAALIVRPSHNHACIEGWPADIFATLDTPLDRLDIFSNDEDDLTTALYADAYPVEADKDGRIILPESLVKHAGLTEKIVFMGRGRLFEIWEPAAADRRIAEARERARTRSLSIARAGVPS